jgi:hypothetical protein
MNDQKTGFSDKLLWQVTRHPNRWFQGCRRLVNEILTMINRAVAGTIFPHIYAAAEFVHLNAPRIHRTFSADVGTKGGPLLSCSLRG